MFPSLPLDVAQVGTKAKLLGTAAAHAGAEPVSLPATARLPPTLPSSVHLGVVRGGGEGSRQGSLFGREADIWMHAQTRGTHRELMAIKF